MNYCIELSNCKLLGQGAEGTVYLSKDGYVLKTFSKDKNAKAEADILVKTKNSRFFPNLHLLVSNLVIREFVGGKTLYEHIESKGLSKKLSIEIIDFIEDLKKMKFKRLNIRNAHIFISKNEELKVIDPRKVFTKATPYPKDIIKVLLKHQLFDDFLNHLTQYRPDLLYFWIDGYNYVAKLNKVSRYCK
ncbi:MAG: serine/threonine protein kinase [Clostridium sp.]